MNINAFNLTTGMVIRRDHDTVAVLGKVERDPEMELVYGRFAASGAPFAFDYCDEVQVIGNVIDPHDAIRGAGDLKGIDIGNDALKAPAIRNVI